VRGQLWGYYKDSYLCVVFIINILRCLFGILLRYHLGRAYNRTAHLPERRKMMQQWADYFDTWKGGPEVIPLHGHMA
jgi:hypothetical protein